MDVATKGHNRSKSDSAMKRGWEDKFSYILEASHCLNLDMGELKSCVKVKNRQSLSTEVQNSLKQKILQLQKQLEDQFVVLSALEKAPTYQPLSHEPTNEKPITKPAEDLIEIAILEMKLSLWRSGFFHCIRRHSRKESHFYPNLKEHRNQLQPHTKGCLRKIPDMTVTPKFESSAMNSNFFNSAKELGHISGAKTLLDSSIHRSNSSLSHRSASFRTRMGSIKGAVLSYHSVPLSMLEHNGDEDHLGTSIPDHILKQPNWISEEMIKCITAIYSELSEPPLINWCFPSSPFSFSSISDSSLSTEGRKISARLPWMDNPFNIEGSKELDGSYSTMVEVLWICRDSQRLTHVKDMLQSFRSLIDRMEEIDPQ